MTLGVIGNGFVGSAVVSGFSLHADVRVFDSDARRSTNTFEEVIEGDFVFVCVPTPMDPENGETDRTILDEVVNNISKSKNRNKDLVVVIKSTTPPGTAEWYTERYPELSFVSNPEFLTERTANLDFINANRVVLGGDIKHVDKVTQLYRNRFPYKKIIKTDHTTAQFIKYMCNCFFAVKISFMNEMYQAAASTGANWNDSKNGFVSSGLIANSHLDVPGHDGQYGFGGKCFPKDINSFIRVLENSGIEPTMLKAAWNKNLEVRKNHKITLGEKNE